MSYNASDNHVPQIPHAHGVNLEWAKPNLVKYVLEYEAKHSYIGATLGRVTDRISGAKFMLDGKEINISANDGPNQVHGGTYGFDIVCTAINISLRSKPAN